MLYNNNSMFDILFQSIDFSIMNIQTRCLENNSCELVKASLEVSRDMMDQCSKYYSKSPRWGRTKLMNSTFFIVNSSILHFENFGFC